MPEIKKIVLAGGSGYIGTVLCNYFRDRAEEIVILSRGAAGVSGNIRTVNWNAETTGDWYKELEEADVLINLAGKNINCRFTEENKKEILDSRLDSVKVLSAALKKCTSPPRLWIQCASAGIYSELPDRSMTEVNGVQGHDFLAEVCKLWEKTFWEYTLDFDGTRKIILRNSLVLGKREGAFPRLRNLVKFGLGGKQGSGRQWVSWVHEDDLAGIVEWIISHPEIHGLINCTSAEPMQNRDFMQVIRRTMNMPIGIPSPSWLIKLGAFVIGTDPDLILKSSRVMPEKILKQGYVFKYVSLNEAVKEIIN